MCARFRFPGNVLAIILLGILVLTGCDMGPDKPAAIPSATGSATEQPAIVGPQSARDVALAYIRTYHPGTHPPKDAFWFEESSDQGELAGSSSVIYRYEAWVVTVTFPPADPDSTIYTVTIENASLGYLWQGLLAANGQVVETSYIVEDIQPTIAPPTPTSSPEPTPTLTPTPLPTRQPTQTATATPIPDPCNAAEFVADVTVQDGVILPQGSNFIKTWRLKNAGTCTWTTDYDLVFVDGRLMGGNQTQSLPGRVLPGESIDLSVALKAPKDTGDYKGFWMLRDDRGMLFGLGELANKAFWVNITVVDFDEGSYAYDFSLNFCAATWRSDKGRLPCPGFVNSADGFVQLLANADLELRRENQPTLWVHPNEARYGWIEGTYPSFKVESGDHFMAWVGCMKGYDLCSLDFYLAYLDENGKIHQLGEWAETYDREVTKIDIDLSELAGQKIRFILGVEVNTKNVDDAQGFWFVPRIE